MSLRCTNPNCLFESILGAPFCMGCGAELQSESQRTTPSQAHTPSESADEGICDICAVKLRSDGKHLVSPREMRIIAGNGYGRFVNIWGNIPPAARESKLYDLALHDDTDWALCSSCYQKTSEYSVDKEDGLSHEDFREMFMKPMWEQFGVTPQGSSARQSSRQFPAESEAKAAFHPGSNTDQRPKSRRGLVLLLLIAVILVGGFLYWTSQGNSQQLSQQEAQTAFDEGLNLAKAHRYPEATAAFQKAVKLRPDFAEADAQLGLAYQKLGRTQEAIEAAQRAVDLKSGEAWTHRNLGEVYRASERWYEAIEAYRRATALKSDYVEAYNAIGFCYRKLKDPKNALDAYSRAILINSDYVQAHYGLGLAFLDLNDFESAGNEADILVSLNRADLAKSLRKFIKPEVPADTTSEETTSP